MLLTYLLIPLLPSCVSSPFADASSDNAALYAHNSPSNRPPILPICPSSSDPRRIIYRVPRTDTIVELETFHFSAHLPTPATLRESLRLAHSDIRRQATAAGGQFFPLTSPYDYRDTDIVIRAIEKYPPTERRRLLYNDLDNMITAIELKAEALGYLEMRLVINRAEGRGRVSTLLGSASIGNTYRNVGAENRTLALRVKGADGRH